MVGKNLAPVIIKRKKVIVSGGASWWRLESRLCGFRHSNDGFLHVDVVAECDHGEAKKRIGRLLPSNDCSEPHFREGVTVCCLVIAYFQKRL